MLKEIRSTEEPCTRKDSDLKILENNINQLENKCRNAKEGVEDIFLMLTQGSTARSDGPCKKEKDSEMPENRFIKMNHKIAQSTDLLQELFKGIDLIKEILE